MFNTLGLHKNLVKAVETLGFSEPTTIQKLLIPVAMEGRDIQANAETGSGKSAAFLLPVLHRMLEKPSPDTAVRCLVMSPTRELADQLSSQCKALCKFTSISNQLVVGGLGFREQQARLRKNPEVVIGTPGRLLEHIQKGSLELGDLEYLVLDEADRMLDMGLKDEVLAITAACAENRQTILLSATLDHRSLNSITKDLLKNPARIKASEVRQEHSQIKQQVILADDPKLKQQQCRWLLAHEEFQKALVFTNTRDNAEQLAVFLIQQNVKAVCLHGEMLPEERRQVMSGFRSGRFSVLVSTDLAARGLDIEGIGLVINFAMARSGKDYVHRIGRTGRAEQTGLAISLVAPQEWNLMQSIARYLNLDFDMRQIEELPAKFKGQASIGKKKQDKKKSKKTKSVGGKQKTAVKEKQRHRNKKNIGKRRAPAKSAEQSAHNDLGDGFGPLRKK